jgi:hypothetical protein
MQVTLNVSEGVAAQAKRLGIPVEEYAQRALDESVPQVTEWHRRKMTEEEIQAWFEKLTRFSDKIPPMPGETFSRDMIYQDHD